MANPKNSKPIIIKLDTYLRMCRGRKQTVYREANPLRLEPVDVLINRLANDSAILAELKKHVIRTGKPIPTEAHIFYLSQPSCLMCLDEQGARAELVRSMEMCEIGGVILDWISLLSDASNLPDICLEVDIKRTPAVVLVVGNEVFGPFPTVLGAVEKWKAVRVCAELMA